jgi:hypothetical protein
MTSPADRISHLVSTGKISAAEGERLQLALMAAPRKQSGWRLLFNPFDRFGGERAAVAGVVVSAASLALGRFGAHFDGFLDVHAAARGGLAATFGTSLREQAVAWLVPSLLFWIYARVMAKQDQVAADPKLLTIDPGRIRVPRSLGRWSWVERGQARRSARSG